jgi:hypothetical protein
MTAQYQIKQRRAAVACPHDENYRPDGNVLLVDNLTRSLTGDTFSVSHRFNAPDPVTVPGQF